MLGGFARCIDAVVAGQAGSLGDTLVTENDDVPCRGAVAGIAVLRGGDVAKRELGGHRSAGVAMAGSTIPGRASKDALEMAGLTACDRMLGRKREPRRGVVERRIGAWLSLRQHGSTGEREDNGTPEPD